MNFIFEFLLQLLKNFLQAFMKTCADKNIKPEVKVSRPRKRTTSISKTETVVVETVSESVSNSNEEKKKK